MKPSSPKDRLIFALDVESVGEAERLVNKLAPYVGMFKVGPRIFTRAGSLVFDLIHGMGSSVFLDLKFHDIPATVGGAVREVVRQRARMFTVHALGGARMLQSALEVLHTGTLIPGVPAPLCLAVTILTSHASHDLEELGVSLPIEELVPRLARVAVENGAGGIVSSGHELRRLREILPDHTVFVTPGIRGPSDEALDQTRVMTPRAAVEAGASYLVVGRPIRLAKDPVEAAKRILEDIDRARV